MFKAVFGFSLEHRRAPLEPRVTITTLILFSRSIQMAGLSARNMPSMDRLFSSDFKGWNKFLVQRAFAIAMSSSWFGDTIVIYKKQNLNPMV